MSDWQCGDCGTVYPKSVFYCTNSLDDYLAVHGGSVEAAIQLAVEQAIAPLAATALARLAPDRAYWTVKWTRMVPTERSHTWTSLARWSPAVTS